MLDCVVTMDSRHHNETVPSTCIGEGFEGASTPMELAGGGYDHMRALGDWDLKLNYPLVIAKSNDLH